MQKKITLKVIVLDVNNTVVNIEVFKDLTDEMAEKILRNVATTFGGELTFKVDGEDEFVGELKRENGERVIAMAF